MQGTADAFAEKELDHELRGTPSSACHKAKPHEADGKPWVIDLQAHDFQRAQESVLGSRARPCF
jgi:hypothetical protein